MGREERQEKFRRIEQAVDHDLNSISRQNPHGGYPLKKKMKAVKLGERGMNGRFQTKREMSWETEDGDLLVAKGKNAR